MVMLLMLVSFMFPSGNLSRLGSSSSSSGGGPSRNAAGGSGGGGYVYNIVLDAGSTGSRIHIFKFRQASGKLLLQSDGFHQLKPGLSSFADNPQAAADSLKPLMAEALKAVPKELQVRACACGAWGLGGAALASAAHACGLVPPSADGGVASWQQLTSCACAPAAPPPAGQHRAVAQGHSWPAAAAGQQGRRHPQSRQGVPGQPPLQDARG